MVDAVQRDKFVTTHESGTAYSVSDMTQLRRFLVLGSEGGSFYVTPRELTDMNIMSVKAALDQNYRDVIDTIVSVSDQALAPSNEPALLALSIAASHKDVRVRQYALEALPKVARTGTHLFHFVGYVTKQRGWGNALRRAVAQWYTERSTMSLVNQLTKYQKRDGWSHKDLINLVHPKPKNDIQEQLFRYFTYGNNEITADNQAADYLSAIRLAHETREVGVIVNLIREYNLPREVLPTWALNEVAIWDAMLPSMPLMAMIRNLGKMTEVGLLTPLSDAEKLIMNKLVNEEDMRASRLHPLGFLKAKLVYGSGRGVQGKKTWTPSQEVVAALEEAYYASFGNVIPTGKRGIIALDVSSSMTWGSVANIPSFTPRVASAAMAMVTVRTEQQVEILGFSHELLPLDITRHDSLEDITSKIARMRFGGTDCGLPMRYARDNNRQADYFITYTDSETIGNPQAGIAAYRQASGITDARYITVGMVANNFSLADPNDPFALDVVGFDTSAPAVMSEFIRGTV